MIEPGDISEGDVLYWDGASRTESGAVVKGPRGGLVVRHNGGGTFRLEDIVSSVGCRAGAGEAAQKITEGKEHKTK